MFVDLSATARRFVRTSLAMPVALALGTFSIALPATNAASPTGDGPTAGADALVETVRACWTGLLEEMEEAAALPATVLVRAAAGPAGRPFRELESWSRAHPLLGEPAAVTIYSREGDPLAWWGPARTAEPPPRPRSRAFTLVETAGDGILVLARPIAEGPVGLVTVEVRLWSRDGPSPALFPESVGARSGRSPRAERIRVTSPARRHEPSPDLPGLEEEPPAEGTAGDGGQAGPRTIVLNDPDGSPLALAHLPDSGAPSGPGPLRAAGLLAACVALTLVLVRTARPLRPPHRDRAPLAAAAVCVLAAIGLRLALAPLLRAFGVPGALTGPDVFAVPSPLGLASSPVDLFLTSATFAATTAVLLVVLADAARRSAVRVALGLTGAVLLVGCLRFVVALPVVSKINPIRFQLLSPDPPRLLLQAACVLLVAGPVAMLVAALRPHSPRVRPGASADGDAGGGPTARRMLIVALATLVAGGGLISGEARASRLLVENDLAEEVLRRDAKFDDMLAEVLLHAEDHPRWSSLRDSEDGVPDPALATECWAGSRLAVDGVRSAIGVIDSEGFVRSEFTNGLPPGIAREIVEPPDSEEILVMEDVYSLLTLRVPLLRGEGPIYDENGPVGRLVVLMSLEPDNLPFFTRNDPLAASLSPGGLDPIYREFLGGEPLLVVMSAEGEATFTSARRAPDLRASLPEKISTLGPHWKVLDVGGRRHRLFYFPSGDGFAAIGYPHGGIAQDVSVLVRLTVLALLAALLAHVTFGVAAAPVRTLRELSTGWLEALRRSWARRLLAALLAASILPLVGMSLFLRGQVIEHQKETIESSGLSALESARRLLQDYLVSTSAEDETADGTAHAEVEENAGTEDERPEEAAGAGSTGRVESDALFWLSRVVGQDLAVFLDGRIAAASRPELYAAGLLSPRLDAEVAHRILHRRAAYTLREETIGPERALFIYAPLDLQGTSGTGVIALPLSVPQREARSEADALGEGLLTITALLGALIAAIAVATSRRISGPIRALTRATARVADGDYSVRLDALTPDETGRMAGAFNRMAEALEGQREDLRRRGDYIEKILLNATTGVISTDSTGTIRTINPAARLLLELDGDLEGASLPHRLARHERLEPVVRLVSGALAGPEEKIEREIDLPAGRGRQQRIRCVILPLREEPRGRSGRIVLVEDLTELVRSNRLEAWAEMARRIAHEIKNPLTPIQLSAEHLERLHRGADRDTFDRVLGECVKTILDQVQTLREISAEFSSYARLPTLQLEPVDAARLVRDVIAPYRLSPPGGVRIDEDVREVPPLPGDPRVLRRALVNLVENALQAMPDGGVLSVSVRSEDDRVVVELSDTGEGMDDETLARIFEPYFSTRDAGTGLGLAIARRAVEEHGGSLSATSARGRGTVMTMSLPVRDERPRSAAPVDSGSAPPEGA